MAITIDWATRVILIPISFLTLITPATSSTQALYELDVDALRLALKDIEDDEGMPYPDTHSHNSAYTVSGVTYAQSFQVINGYTVEFDDNIVDHYTVRCVGANHNLGETIVLNTVSLIIGNSAGLVTVTENTGSGLSVEQAAMLAEIYQRLGLQLGKPLTQTATQIATDDFTLAVAEPVAGTVTVTRQ